MWSHQEISPDNLQSNKTRDVASQANSCRAHLSIFCECFLRWNAKSSKFVLHNIARISLLSVKDHKLLMNLLCLGMALNGTWLYHDRIVGTWRLPSKRWPSFLLSSFSCKVTITKCNPRNNQRPLRPTITTERLVVLTSILVTLTCSTSKINSCTIKSILTCSMIKTFSNNRICIFPWGTMQQNFFIHIRI